MTLVTLKRKVTVVFLFLTFIMETITEIKTHDVVAPQAIEDFTEAREDGFEVVDAQWISTEHTAQKLRNVQIESAQKNIEFQQYDDETGRIAERFITEKRFPMCKRSDRIRLMTSRAGTAFSVYYDDMSFYSGNDRRAEDVFIITDTLIGHDERQRSVFTYGQMEGARKLLMRPLGRHIKELKAAKRKIKYIKQSIAHFCYSFLRKIQTEISGLAQEFREFFEKRFEEQQPIAQEVVENTPEELETVEVEEINCALPELCRAVGIHEPETPFCRVTVSKVQTEDKPMEVGVHEPNTPSEVTSTFDNFLGHPDNIPVDGSCFSGITKKEIRRARRIKKILRDDQFYDETAWSDPETEETHEDVDECLCEICVLEFIARAPHVVHNRYVNPPPFKRYNVDQLTFTKLIKPKAQADVQNEVTKEENTIFTDQRSTVMDDGYVTSQIEPNMKQLSMQEDQWHVSEILRKPIPFYNGDWTTSQSQGHIIKQWDLPGDTLLGPHYNQTATFVFWRGHPTLRFQINGTKFHSGRLIAAFIPAFQFTQYDDKLYNLDSLLSLPHVILDAGFSNSGVINLPFVHMNTYFNTVQGSRGWQSLGRLILAVFNRLGSASTSSQNIGVTAWVSYDNCELHQPCYAHTVNLPKAKQTQPQAQAAVEGLVKSVLPMITDMVAPGMGSLGSVMGGASDCDKPTDPVEISRWVPNAVTSLSLGTGIDKSSRLSLQTGTYTIGDADLISTTQDDMNLLMISKIPTRLCTLQWSSTTDTGTRIVKIPTCPNLYNTRTFNDKVDPKVEIHVPTLLAYNSRSFKYWRGGLRYKIQLIASQMHSGRIMIAFGPGMTDMQFDGATYINTYVIDLQERHEVEFEVPFLAERPWNRCDRMRKLDSTGTTEVEHDNYENTGYLFIYVLNRLSRPDSVSAAIDINVLVSAADDFELAVPADFSCFQGIGDVVDITPGAVAQALVGQKDVTNRTDEGVVSLTKGGGKLGAAAVSTMSENAMNLKTLLRRYYKVYTNKATLNHQTSSISFENSPTLSGVHKCFNNGNAMQMRTHLAHFSELFTFWRGSLRYKLIWTLINDTHTPSLTVRVYHVPGAFILGNFTPAEVDQKNRAVLNACEAYGTLLGQTNIQSSLEFEVPFYTPYTQLRTIQANQPDAKSSTGVIVVVFDYPNQAHETHMNIDLYQAAGDDFALNYLRAAPKIQWVRGAEEKRELDDNALFIYGQPADTPNICPSSTAQPRAQALVDSIPLIGDHIRATRSLAAAGDSMSGVCDTARHIMQQAATKVGLTSSDDDEENEEPTIMQTVTRTASDLSDPIISIFTTLSEYLKNLPAAMGLETRYEVFDAVTDVSILVTAFKAYQDDSITMKTLAVISIVTTLFGSIGTIARNLLYRFAANVISNLYGSRKGNELPNAQSEIFDFIAPLTATLSIAVGLLGFKSIPSDKETSDTIKAISEKLRLFNFSSLALNNIKALWLQLKEVFEWVTEKVVGLWSAEYLAQMKLHREFEKVEEWAAFVDELENINYEDRIHYDPEFKRRVYRAVDMGKRYTALLTQGKFGREMNVVKEYCRKALEICTKCDKSRNTLPFRKDPFCIAMYGASGVGKSGVITKLGYDIMNQLEYPLHNRWCAINCNDKFFNENYNQQTAVYFDDFSQFTTEEQYQQFFNLKSNTAYPLNMAFKKGEYFNSDFIFMTTNTSHPNPNCLTCIPALWRRRDILIEADFIPEVREAGMAGEYVMREDQSHARYRLISPREEGVVLEDWMDYPALVAELMVRAQEHRTRQERKLERDLEMAGYIVPRAQAGKIRKVCIEACQNAPSLMLFDSGIWEHVIYSAEHELFTLSQEAPEDIKRAYAEMQASFEALGMPSDEFQRRMMQHSYEVKEKTTLITKVRGSLKSLRDVVGDIFSKLCGVIPAIGVLARCAFTLAITFLVWKTITSCVVSVVHSCACVALRFFGFRCGLCGRWPKLSSCKDKTFILREWASLYADTPYTDGHLTTPEEEWTIRAIQSGERKVSNVWVGTQVKAEGGPYSDDTKGARITKIVANASPYNMETKSAKPGKILAQAQDKHVTDLINNRVIGCNYRIKFDGNRRCPPLSMQAFAIGARMLIVPGHFFMHMDEGDYWEIFHSNVWMRVEYNKEKAAALEHKDIIVYEMPLMFHLHKSNINHFVSEQELAYARKFPFTMVVTNNNLQTLMRESTVEPVEHIDYVYDIAGTETQIRVQNAWKYRMLTQAGDCGAPLLAHCTKLQGRILGFHVCGNGVHGWATLVTREMLEKFVTRHEGSCLPPAQAKLGNLIPQGHFGRIGKSDKIFFQNDDTQIIKTDIHGEITPPVTFPAVLSRNDPRLEKRVNPLQVGISKYAAALKPFPLEHRKLVNDFLRSELHTYKRLRKPKLLTDLETVKGIPEFEQAFEPLPMNTSPGWPYVNTRPRGASGKSYLFDINGQITDAELKRRFEEREECARRGERVQSVWVDCLKDERRPMEKIVSGSTRVFTIGPVDFSLLCRKYCQDFVESIKASRAFSHCKLGVDPQSLEWTELHTYLSSFSDSIVAGDFTRFDGTVHGELIGDYFDDVDYFYKQFGDWTPDDSKVREVLADEIVNTVQLAKDEFYMTHGGNPSGNQQTTPLNSRTNFRYMALSWLGLASRNALLWRYYNMSAFEHNVRIACYGDDNLLAIKKDVIEWFNQETISAYLEEFGIVYTNETKDGITKYKKLDECTFLKQGFRDHENIKGVKAPLMKESTLMELLNWTKIAPDQDELLADNCTDCLRFAYFYGEKYFNNLRTKIQNALNKHEKNFRLMTFLDFHYWFLGVCGMVETKVFKPSGP